MGLFDKLFKKSDAQPTAGGLEAVAVESEPNAVFAPVSGTAVALVNVPDPVFAGGALGKGIAFEPTEGVIYAPVSGTVTATTPTLHALGFAADNGAEVLVHVGIDTVEMKGDGFKGFVSQGDKIVAGQPLMTFDRKKIAAAGHPDTVIMAITNTDDFASVDPVPAAPIKAGAVALRLSR